ncbi:hypothetical protein NBRC111894_2320 [Sporolactobacillus inulinus]|uniref:Uncharacterized protein n=1 Tax=Sporolactobacillus inulinus TaxID=2078 RepID=A0A4Y1ZCD8_9BACL|nr:hypothetical protein NBRC111894_2320 [Sporolactobacillus inulinus]
MASKELDKIIEEYNTYEMRNQFIIPSLSMMNALKHFVP